MCESFHRFNYFSNNLVIKRIFHRVFFLDVLSHTHTFANTIFWWFGPSTSFCITDRAAFILMLKSGTFSWELKIDENNRILFQTYIKFSYFVLLWHKWLSKLKLKQLSFSLLNILIRKFFEQYNRKENFFYTS
jgi:hypothetical protein